MTELQSDPLLQEIEALTDCAGLGRRLAVVTCDVEQDYGNRTGDSQLLEDRRYLDELAERCRAINVPLSVFVVTQCLHDHPHLIDVIADHDLDFHAHSHTHNVDQYRHRSAHEIRRAQDAFTRAFGRPALGYRAPQGVISQADPAALAECGFALSSSVFPSRRRGLFDFRRLPQTPWRRRTGVTELPMASSLRARKMLTMSYLKLFGRRYWGRRISPAHLPEVVVIDSHLHDFFVADGFANLPLKFRIAYTRNKRRGLELLSWLAVLLTKADYSFITMTELYKRVASL